MDGLIQLPHPPSSPVVHRILPDLRSQANMPDIIVHTDVWIAAAPGSTSFLPKAYRLECRSVFDVRVDRLAADVVVIVAVGEIDSVTAPTLSASLHRELEHAPTVLVLDLTAVSFLGVAGLHVLDCALARAETLSVTVKLVHDEHSAVQSALRAAAMTGLFPTFRTVDLACAPSS